MYSLHNKAFKNKQSYYLSKELLKMKLSPASVWRLNIRSDGTMYPRSKHATRHSLRVKDRNKALIAAAKKCADQALDGFRACVAEELNDTKAPGTDAPIYTYAKAHRTQALRVAGMPRAKILGGKVAD